MRAICHGPCSALSGRQSLPAWEANSAAIVMAGRQREVHQEGVGRLTGVFPRKIVRMARRIDPWRTMHSSRRMVAFAKTKIGLLEMEGMGPFLVICRGRWHS
jgi:hypothetical protein